MNYLLLIYEAEGAYEGPQGETALAQIVAKHMELGKDLAASGVVFSGDGLQPSAATTVRTAAAAYRPCTTAPSPRPASTWAATTGWTCPTWTRRWPGPGRSRWCPAAWSRSATG